MKRSRQEQRSRPQEEAASERTARRMMLLGSMQKTKSLGEVWELSLYYTDEVRMET